jgi:hypothetical protein
MGYGYNTWEDMIDIWADEFHEYKYGTEDLQLNALHFTEIVWKSTVSVGKLRLMSVYARTSHWKNPPKTMEIHFLLFDRMRKEKL